MKIINQLGENCEVFDLEQSGLYLYGQPRNIRKPKIILGTYPNQKRVFDIMAEIYCINSNDKNTVFTMPLE